MAEVFNADVAGIYRRVQRIIVEVSKSQSSGVVGVIEADAVRLAKYLENLGRYKTWVTGEPQLDLPESHPTAIVLEEPAEMPDIENESLTDFRQLMKSLSIEMINSQSARLPSGLLDFDAARFDSITAKAASLLENYISPSQPVDFPESSPDEVGTGAGRMGI